MRNIIIGILFLVAPMIKATEVSRLPFVFASMTTAPIAVDGSLSEPGWAKAPVAGAFVDISDNSKAAGVQTSFRVLYDAKTLYIGIEAEDPEPGKLEMKKTDHDVWPSGDALELFLDPGLTRNKYYQFAVGLGGGQYEGCMLDPKWNIQWQAVTRVNDKGWSAEIVIPFSGLKVSPPVIGDWWGLNVCRNREGGGQFSSTWSAAGSTFHNPEKFNILIFGNPDDYLKGELARDKKQSADLRQQAQALKERGVDLMAELKEADALLAGLAVKEWHWTPDKPADFLPVFNLRRNYRAIADKLQVIHDIFPVNGMVFLDENRDGERQAGEKGIAGIPVSNGSEIILTGTNGQFTLAIDSSRSRCVFFIQPAEYERTTGYYQWLSPTNQSLSIRFGLVPRPGKMTNTFTFIHITDLHLPYCSTNEDGFRRLIFRQVRETPAAFIMNTGDNVHDRADQFPSITEQISLLGPRLYNVIGNHDYTNVKDNNADCYNTVFVREQYLGPVWYSFNYGSRHFVALDSFASLAHGQRAQHQLEWLKKDLALCGHDKTIILFQHFPDSDKYLTGILAGHKLEAVFNGDWHVDGVYHDPQGTLQVITRPLFFSCSDTLGFPAFRIVSVHDQGLAMELRLAGIEKRLTVVTADQTGTRAAAGDVRANLYDTMGLPERCEFQINKSGNWIAMKHKGGWLWEGAWPAGGTPDACQLTIRVTGPGGTSWGAREVGRVGKDRRIDPQPDNDWPMFQGDPAHTGCARDAVAPPFKICWARNYGAGVAAPIVAGQKVFLSIADDDNGASGGVVALDARSGEIVWKAITGDSVNNSPAFNNGVIYAISRVGHVYAVNAQTGKELWRNNDPEPTKGVVYSSPLISGDRLYAARASYKTDALNINTGERMWTGPGGIGIVVSCISPCMDQKHVYLAYHQTSGGLYAFAKDSGKKIWNRNITEGFLKTSSQASPVVSEGILYFSANMRLYALDPATGNEIWNFPYGGKRTWPMQPTSTPAVSQGKLYVGSEIDGKVLALDARNGKTIWQFQTERSLLPYGKFGDRSAPCVLASPVISGNVVYVGALDGCLYALNAENGHVLWKFNFGLPITSAVAISGNMIFLRTYDGTLYAIVGEKIAT